MFEKYKVEPGKKVRLSEYDAGDRGGQTKSEAAPETAQYLDELDDLVYRLYAEHKQSLLLVLQGLDGAGKDGTIRHVMSGISPQACSVSSFKQPTQEELDHDFLWRIHRQAPRRGMVGIFNRSHYEDVLVVRVHKLIDRKTWEERYERINEFERLLSDSGTRIVKIFLHIDKEEQRQRLQARLDNPDKRWKFSKSDVAERQFWDDYQKAYEDALSHCSTDVAPWYVVPSNHKWFRNLVISRIVRDTLRDMNPQFPPPEADLDKVVLT